MSTRESKLSAAEQTVVDAVLRMYGQGWFPMYDDESGVTQWVQPRRRGIIPLDDRFQPARSLRAKIRRGGFALTTDRCFEQVMRECAKPAPGRDRTWLNDEITQAFVLLHRAGVAHSIEAWCEDRLVGGLYGLALGGVFCGESMFSRPELGGTDASKVCLCQLVSHLRARGFAVLDSQLSNPHLDQFGCYEISQAEYQELLDAHASEPGRTWLPFDVLREWR